MTEEELIEKATRLLRQTRDKEVVDICSEVLSRIATLRLPDKPAFDRRAYQRNYMRNYRNRQKSNPFEG